MTDTPERPFDPVASIRGFLLLDAAVRLLIYGAALMVTFVTVTAMEAWPHAAMANANWQVAWDWATTVILMIVLFNMSYVAILIILRLPIPQPREGTYPLGRGMRIDRQLVWSCLLAVLTKARHKAPFPGFLVFHVANIPPLCWIMGPVFGPKSRSCYILEPTILDPHLVTLGRNVVIGFGTTLAGHYQERDRIVIRRTIIEDDVVIGAHSAISGSHIKKGAMIGAGSIVMPGTLVGPGELWSGNPARRRRVVTAPDSIAEASKPEPETENRPRWTDEEEPALQG